MRRSAFWLKHQASRIRIGIIIPTERAVIVQDVDGTAAHAAVSGTPDHKAVVELLKCAISATLAGLWAADAVTDLLNAVVDTSEAALAIHEWIDLFRWIGQSSRLIFAERLVGTALTLTFYHGVDGIAGCPPVHCAMLEDLISNAEGLLVACGAADGIAYYDILFVQNAKAAALA